MKVKLKDFRSIKLWFQYRKLQFILWWNKHIKFPLIKIWFKIKLKVQSFHLIFKSYDQRFLYRVRIFEELSRESINPARNLGARSKKGQTFWYGKTSTIAKESFNVNLSSPMLWSDKYLKEVYKWGYLYKKKKSRLNKLKNTLRRLYVFN